VNTLHRERSHEPEGRCILRVDKVIAEDDCLVWSFVVDQGRCQGSQLRHLTPLAQHQLWPLRNLLETLGIEIPDGPFDFNPNELAGLTVGGTVKDGGIVDFWPVENEDVAATEFIDATQRAIDRARADLDRAIEAYARARTAECEDIERQRWKARSKAR
jgi:hypothetical protein